MLYIYQPVHRFPLAESGFWEKLAKASINGWNGLFGFIIGLISLWPLFLIVYGGWMGYRFWRKRKGKRAAAKFLVLQQPLFIKTNARSIFEFVNAFDIMESYDLRKNVKAFIIFANRYF